MSEKNTPNRSGCVVLAAGLGTRFGGGKLLAEFHGQPLYRLAFQAVPEKLLWKTVVVAREDAILREAEQRGFLPVFNAHPEEGVSRSIRLGLKPLEEADRVLFLVSDQPLLRRETAGRILQAGEAHPGRIVSPVRADGRPGNPCLFPSRFFPELFSLTGDRGGRQVIRAHPNSVLLLSVEAQELADADDPRELERLRGL